MDTQTPASHEPAFACAESDVPRDGTVVTRTIGGQSIALSRRSENDEAIVAFESRCPHFKGPLKFGRVVEGEVICPWHFMRFNTTTGETTACDKSLMKLKVYPVTLVDGNVHVQLMS